MSEGEGEEQEAMDQITFRQLADGSLHALLSCTVRHRHGVYRRPTDWLAQAGHTIAWGARGAKPGDAGRNVGRYQSSVAQQCREILQRTAMSELSFERCVCATFAMLAVNCRLIPLNALRQPPGK